MARCTVFVATVTAALLLLATPVVQAEPASAAEWSLDFAFQQYFLPDEDDLSIPVLTLSSENVLVEARYNYELRDAGSLWLGKPFSFGETWEIELVPMVGVIFGAMKGVAPGLKADISWKSLNLYSELEYAFDADARENNFFYTWSELTVGILDWLSIGVVGTRSRAYDSPVELDRGPIVWLEFEHVSISCAGLNLDSDPLVIFGADLALGDWLG